MSYLGAALELLGRCAAAGTTPSKQCQISHIHVQRGGRKKLVLRYDDVGDHPEPAGSGIVNNTARVVEIQTLPGVLAKSAKPLALTTGKRNPTILRGDGLDKK